MSTATDVRGAGSAGAPRSGESVSVIVPAYNAAPYLDAALASVAAQTVRPAEVVVADDGSRDATRRIAERWAAVLPLELVGGHENKGLGRARHEAILSSKGSLIALLDADDYWLPDHLEVMLATYRRHGGIVTPDHYRWVAGQRLGNVAASRCRPLPPPDEQPRAILEANFVSYGCLFSRTAYHAAGGFRDMRASEDWDLWIRMIRSGYRVSRPDTVTLMYRKRPDSLSAANGTTPTDVAIFEELAQSSTGADRRLARRMLRRHTARLELLRGLDAAAGGDRATATRCWVRAALLDPSLRRGPGVRGSTSARALLCLLAPRYALALRDRRARDPVLLTDL